MEMKERDHLLALKVMRLTRPTFHTPLPLFYDSKDLLGSSFITHRKNELDYRGDSDVDQLAIGQLLMLPQSFGNIYLGETFSSYISVHNDSTESTKDVSVKADIQTGSQRIPISGQSTDIYAQVLEPAKSLDDVIHHEVKEIGTHILVCAVNYTTDNGEKMSFRKFFKFQVMKPLDVKTKFYNAESDELYLEAQVTNLTLTPISLEKVSLEPVSAYTVKNLNTIPGDKGEKESVFGEINVLLPTASRQYLYCLSPTHDGEVDKTDARGSTAIGKLDIVWRSAFGERGRLQTSQLQRVAPNYGDIRLTVLSIPGQVVIDEPFQVRCRLTNCSQRAMELILKLEKHLSAPGLCWLGISGRSLGRMEANEKKELLLELVPVLPGLQSISGIQLVDPFLKRTYEYDEIAQVFVVQK